MKRLGVTFCERFKETSEANWNKMIEKMENDTRKLRRRSLSLHGNAMLS